MTAKNSILLIINQSPGIDYNSLLNKIAPNYSNINSARAALSRATKDLIVFGFVVKQRNNFFATDKAGALINSEMKNKLLMRLNQTINSKNAASDIDSIVQQLQMLIERGKQDPNLLKAAKGSTKFNVQDLVEIEQSVSKQAKHMLYLHGILLDQLNAMRDLDFNDYKKIPFDDAAKNSIRGLYKSFSISEAVLESQSDEFMQKIASELSLPARKNFSIKYDDLGRFFALLDAQKQLPEMYMFLSQVKVKFTGNEVFFMGPSSSLKQL